MKAKNVMIDLETLGTSVNAAIIQIGVVADIESEAEFSATINFNSALKYGEVDGDCLAWWFKQEESVRKSALESPIEAEKAFSMLHTWIFRNTDKKTKFWAHATFDFPILQQTAQKIMGKPILPYKRLYDIRTIQLAYGDNIDWVKREGVRHNALDDAKFQMKNLLSMLPLMHR